MVQKTTIKYTNKNGKNIAIKNFPLDGEGHKTSLGVIRYLKRKAIRYPEILVNGEWVMLHRYMLQIHNVEVPQGYDVHHNNGDLFDARISNLAVLSRINHVKVHLTYDMENGVATEYEHIYEIPTGGYKYINLNLPNKDVILLNGEGWGRSPDAVMEKVTVMGY